MQRNEFKVEVEKIHDICMNVLFKKGAEYQNNNVGQDEVLANFYRGSETIEVIPEKVLLIYMSKHWDSISKFIKTIDKDGFDKAVGLSTEPIHMRIVDIINYLYLLNAMIIERQRKNQDANFPNVFDKRPSPLYSTVKFEEIKETVAQISSNVVTSNVVINAAEAIASAFKCEVLPTQYDVKSEMTDEMKVALASVSQPSWTPIDKVSNELDRDKLSED